MGSPRTGGGTPGRNGGAGSPAGPGGHRGVGGGGTAGRTEEARAIGASSTSGTPSRRWWRRGSPGGRGWRSPGPGRRHRPATAGRQVVGAGGGGRRVGDLRLARRPRSWRQRRTSWAEAWSGGARPVLDFPDGVPRINGLPPYVFATINDLKAASRRSGRDGIDLGFGNPDLPSPDVAVAGWPRPPRTPNRRYSHRRRAQAAQRHHRSLPAQVRGELDPETQVVTAIGAKEGFSHLMWCWSARRRHSCRRRRIDPHLGRSSPVPTCARCCSGARRRVG